MEIPDEVVMKELGVDKGNIRRDLSDKDASRSFSYDMDSRWLNEQIANGNAKLHDFEVKNAYHPEDRFGNLCKL